MMQGALKYMIHHPDARATFSVIMPHGVMPRRHRNRFAAWRSLHCLLIDEMFLDSQWERASKSSEERLRHDCQKGANSHVNG